MTMKMKKKQEGTACRKYAARRLDTWGINDEGIDG